MGLETKDVAVAVAAFLGSFLGQLRTRQSVAELVRPRARRFWVALCGLSRRVAELERRAEASREA